VLGCKTLWCGCDQNGTQPSISNTRASTENLFINSKVTNLFGLAQGENQAKRRLMATSNWVDL
jgi:hypothetical protein